MIDPKKQTEELVGFEVAAATFRAVLIEPNGNLIDSLEQPVDDGVDTSSQLIDFIKIAMDRFGNGRKIGVAVPGLVNQEQRNVVFSTFVPDLEKKDFRLEIEAATGLEVVVENDANAAGYAEFRLGAGRGSINMFYVTLGTGVGGALIIDGEIWRGANGFAGEFGHIAINSEGLKLEGVASGANVIRRTRSRLHQDHTSSLNRIDESEIGLADIVEAAENDDDFARMMLERTGNYVGIAIASVINLLNIEKIVIGGEIMKAENIVLDSIIERASDISFSPSFINSRIVAAELGENATAIGAALLSI